MADDDSINKLIDAKMQFRLKKINDQLAEQGRKPITLKELMMRDRFDASMPPAEIIEEQLPKVEQSTSSIPKNVVSADFTPKPTFEPVVPSEVTDIRKGSLQKFLDSRYGTDEGIQLSKYRNMLSKLPSSDNKIKLSALFNILSDNDHVLNTNEVNFIKHILNNADTIDLNDPKISNFIENREVLITDENIRDLLEAKRQEVLDKSLKKLPTFENKKLNELNIENEKLLAENPELADQRLQQTESVFSPKVKPISEDIKVKPISEDIKFRNTNLSFVDPEYKDLIDKLKKAYNIADIQKSDIDKKTINEIIELLETGTQPDKELMDNINGIITDFERNEQKSKLLDKKYNRKLDFVKGFREDMNMPIRSERRYPKVEYADFRTTGEKARDSVLQGLKEAEANPYVFAQERIAGPAAKLLGRLAIPVAGYDLGKKMFQSGKEIQEAQKEKGVAQDLAETGLDMAILGSPLAKLVQATATSPASAARAGAIATGLDIAALPLGGYLAGKQIEDLMGDGVAEYLTPEEREKDRAALDAKLRATGLTEPTVIGPEQDMDKMYNYSKIKNLLKK